MDLLTQKILISNHIWNNHFYSSITFHVRLNPIEKYETICRQYLIQCKVKEVCPETSLSFPCVFQSRSANKTHKINTLTHTVKNTHILNCV